MTHNQIEFARYHMDKANYERMRSEEARHNRAVELETFRHNTATESIDITKIGETVRHNQESEKISWSNVDVSKEQLAINARQVAEQVRHNKASEKLTRVQNRENIRHNKASESISRANIALGYSNVSLGYAQVAEQHYSNVTARNKLKLVDITNANANHTNALANRYKAHLESTRVGNEVRKNEIYQDQVNKTFYGNLLNAGAKIIGPIAKGLV